MEKIDNLTPEQEEQLREYRAEWLKIGHSTEPLDLVQVESAVENLYGLIDKPKPVIIHCQSPWQMAYTIAAFKQLGKFDGNNLGNNLWNNLWNNLENNLWNNLRNNLGNNLRNNLRNNLENNLRNNLGNNLRNNLGNNLGNNLRNNLRNNLGNNLRNNLGNNLRNNLENNLWNNLENNLRNNLENTLRNNLGNNLENNLDEVVRQEHRWWTSYGPWYLYWLAFYEFPQLYLKPDIYSKEDTRQMKIWIGFAKSVAGWAAYEGVCFVCERPISLKLDSNNRLHNEIGPAIEYSDGLKFYYLHGIHISDPSLIEEEPLQLSRIESETNVELRRVLIDKYGQSSYLIDSGAERIHEDDFGVLYKKDLKGDEPIFMVKVVNSSPEPDGSFRDYFLGVDPKAYGGLKTAKAAVASTWRYSDNSLVFKNFEDYVPLIET